MGVWHSKVQVSSLRGLGVESIRLLEHLGFEDCSALMVTGDRSGGFGARFKGEIRGSGFRVWES